MAFFSTFLPLTLFDKDNDKKHNQFCSGWLNFFFFFLFFVHSSLYSDLQLTLARKIDCLSLNVTMKMEMDQGSVRKTVGVLTPAMFNERFPNVSLAGECECLRPGNEVSKGNLQCMMCRKTRIQFAIMNTYYLRVKSSIQRILKVVRQNIHG